MALIGSRYAPKQYRLRGDTNGTLAVVQGAAGDADAVRSVAGFGAQAGPLTLGQSVEMHDDISIDERPFGDIQFGAYTVDVVSHGEQPL